MDEHRDIVDIFYRPYVRALGNLVITFANAEAALRDMVAEFLGGDELAAAELLKKNDTAKAEVLKLAQSENLSAFESDELVKGVVAYWDDREVRNRLVHDEWYPNLMSEEGDMGSVATRGITRKKSPEFIYGKPTVDEVWLIAERFAEWQSLFSFHQYKKSRHRGAAGAN